MNIFFIGLACTQEVIDESDEKYNNGISIVRPQQYFDLNLIKGLSKYARVKAISEPPVASYPNTRCLLYRNKKEILLDSITIKYIGLINIFIIKTIIISISIALNTLKFCLFNSRKDSAIILGHISFYKWLPVMIITKVLRFKTFLIVPDIPRYSDNYTETNSFVRRSLNKLLRRFNLISEKGFDGFVFLTEHMNKLINSSNKPYIVVEGFVNKNDIIVSKKECKYKKKIVMYAGTLHKKFGICNLVKAFLKIKCTDTELWIYGNGDFSEELKEIAKMHSRIKYKGTRSREEIFSIEKRVTLLVNPRPSDEEFTKYSFPSKTLEYMSSGTPLLTTMLPGIPIEYNKYLYTFENESIESMSSKIETLLSLTDDELINFGKKAQSYVFENKSNIKQAEKIINMINSMFVM